MARPKKKKPRGAVNRLADIQKAKNGSELDAAVTEGDAEGVAEDSNAPKRIPAKKEDWYAAQTHQMRSAMLTQRKEILAKNKVIGQLQAQIATLEERLLPMEEEKLELENAKLRDEHGLDFGRTIHKDDKTGEVYFLEQQDQ